MGHQKSIKPELKKTWEATRLSAGPLEALPDVLRYPRGPRRILAALLAVVVGVPRRAGEGRLAVVALPGSGRGLPTQDDPLVRATRGVAAAAVVGAAVAQVPRVVLAAEGLVGQAQVARGVEATVRRFVMVVLLILEACNSDERSYNAIIKQICMVLQSQRKDYLSQVD